MCPAAAASVVPYPPTRTVPVAGRNLLRTLRRMRGSPDICDLCCWLAQTGRNVLPGRSVQHVSSSRLSIHTGHSLWPAGFRVLVLPSARRPATAISNMQLGVVKVADSSKACTRKRLHDRTHNRLVKDEFLRTQGMTEYALDTCPAARCCGGPGVSLRGVALEATRDVSYLRVCGR